MNEKKILQNLVSSTFIVLCINRLYNASFINFAYYGHTTMKLLDLKSNVLEYEYNL